MRSRYMIRRQIFVAIRYRYRRRKLRKLGFDPDEAEYAHGPVGRPKTLYERRRKLKVPKTIDGLEEYRYKPLLDDQCTRVCAIQPGKPQDPIVIFIWQVRIGTEGAEKIKHGWREVKPAFCVLSYTWGSEEKKFPIFVERPTKTRAEDRRVGPRWDIHWVNQNLYDALRDLRRQDDERMLWIDAISINQNDNVEKGKQVARMFFIYRSALQVLVWLGKSADCSDSAMSFLEELGTSNSDGGERTKQFSVDFRHRTFEIEAIGRGTELTDITDMTKPIYLSPTQLVSMIALLQRPWFARLWIRQEVAVGGRTTDDTDAVDIQCGKREIKWSKFRDALTLLLRKPKITDLNDTLAWSEIRRTLDRLSGILYQPPPGQLDLLTLRAYFNSALCKDPRDRIYAVLSLLKFDLEEMNITPDYTKSYQDVYKTVVLQYMKVFNSLDLLGQCELGSSKVAPSWIPDWSTAAKAPGVVFTFASSHIAAIAAAPQWEQPPPLGDDDDDDDDDDDNERERKREHRHDNILRVAAVTATTLASLGPKIGPRSAYTLEEDGLALRTALSTLEGVDHSSRAEAYARTLLAARENEMCHPPFFNYATFEDCVEVMRRQLLLLLQDHHHPRGGLVYDDVSDDDSDNGASSSWAVSRCAKNLFGRRLGWDAAGNPVLCPEDAEVGDVVSVVLGCRFPMLLRPVVLAAYATAASSTTQQQQRPPWWSVVVPVENNINNSGSSSSSGHSLLSSKDDPTNQAFAEVVGPCFSVDTCDSDALLGPLPEGVRVAGVWHANWSCGFVDDNTGAVSFFDPRLEVDGLGFDVESERLKLKSNVQARTLVNFDALRDLVQERTGNQLSWLNLV